MTKETRTDITIKNAGLTVNLSTLGAEMRSVRDQEGTEYLWNGDPVYWTGQAPNLFPYVGRLTDKKYVLNGRTYLMGIHGFAAQMPFAVEAHEQAAVTFVLEDDAVTRAMYPFHFALRVCYRLSGKRLSVTYFVDNKDMETMYFGLGGHPGFRVPLENGLKFEDYAMAFGEKAAPVRIGIGETGFCTGADAPFALRDGISLPLSHDLFDNDAIVLAGMAHSVTLKSARGKKAVRVEYPDMRYLGLWHMPQTDAPYLCIEPWTSLPSREGIIEDISQQKDLIRLPRNERYQNTWTIEIV